MELYDLIEEIIEIKIQYTEKLELTSAYYLKRLNILELSENKNVETEKAILSEKLDLKM